jgi:hypothetical protein
MGLLLVQGKRRKRQNILNIVYLGEMNQVVFHLYLNTLDIGEMKHLIYSIICPRDIGMQYNLRVTGEKDYQQYYNVVMQEGF